LIGILLNDLPDELSGNLSLFPGSHLSLQQHFRKVGANTLLESKLPDIDLGAPVQITGNAGDMVLVHYQMAHTVSPNISGNVRYVVYFRLHSADHPPGKFRPETVLDVWKDWKGLKSLTS